MTRVLITGGAGFVGSHLADALLERGYGVRIFDNLDPQVHSSSWATFVAKDAEFVRGDVRDREALTHSLRNVDAIFHLAAAVGVGQSMYQIADYVATNTLGTANLLQTILDSKAPVRKLIVASSMSIYGEGKYRCASCGDVAPEPRNQEQLRDKRWEPACAQCGSELQPAATDERKQLQASSLYALTKRDQEDMCLLYGRTYGLPVVALRYFNIYGTRQALSNPYTGVAAIFASRLLNGQPPSIFEDGRQMRDFVSVHDVVRANVLALEGSGADGRPINIGSGTPITILEVAALLAQALDKDIAPEVMHRFRTGDIRHCYANIAAARELLGYEPKVTFESGVRELAEWLRSQRAEDKAAAAHAQLARYGLTA